LQSLARPLKLQTPAVLPRRTLSRRLSLHPLVVLLQRYLRQLVEVSLGDQQTVLRAAWIRRGSILAEAISLARSFSIARVVAGRCKIVAVKSLLAVVCLVCSLTACGQEQGQLTLHEIRAAAEQGDVAVQYSLGSMYEQGRGVAQDYAAAVKWYRQAAEQGDPAQYGGLLPLISQGRHARANQLRLRNSGQ